MDSTPGSGTARCTRGVSALGYWVPDEDSNTAPPHFTGRATTVGLMRPGPWVPPCTGAFDLLPSAGEDAGEGRQLPGGGVPEGRLPSIVSLLGSVRRRHSVPVGSSDFPHVAPLGHSTIMGRRTGC